MNDIERGVILILKLFISCLTERALRNVVGALFMFFFCCLPSQILLENLSLQMASIVHDKTDVTRHFSREELRQVFTL
jgi:formate/nitrite transporter FocA (FNT family)